jgi:DNA (cytosine-5)-methyltransferase 1
MASLLRRLASGQRHPVRGQRLPLVRETLGNCPNLGTRGTDSDCTDTLIAFSAKDHGADAGDTAPTLRAGGHTTSHANAGVMPAIAFDPGPAVMQPLRSNVYNNSDPGMEASMHVRQGMSVRRLTPRECARLMGFTDDYLDIQYRGKPAADGPKYRALGNSFCVPVIRWIGERIQLVEDTVAELRADGGPGES